MRMLNCLILSPLLALFSCSGGDDTQQGNDLEAARNFLRASLDRNWDRAARYMLRDSANMERLETVEINTANEDPEVRRGYREASITTYDINSLNDSTTIVHYSNSFKKIRDSLKVVRVAGEWLVDLKYSFHPPQ